MNELFAKVLKRLAPWSIVLLILWFVYNVYKHGRIKHPGQTTYEVHCASCHGEHGEGVAQLIPPLLRADYAIRHFDSIPCWIKNGMNHPITVGEITYHQVMYGLPLNDVETANVINYISENFLKIDTTINSAWVNMRWKVCP
ncbi:MAG: cytochrome c [Chitinophagales bacterium]|nr:cytochrome c [Chitinophagales bacterium]MDW8419270.1 cytochrome c [Chitinophagales bacterium]